MRVGSSRVPDLTTGDLETCPWYHHAHMNSAATGTLAVPAMADHVANWLPEEFVPHRTAKAATFELHRNLHFRPMAVIRNITGTRGMKRGPLRVKTGPRALS